MKRQAILFISVALLISSAAFCQKAKWTVMIYMNADNDLERFGLRDFLEMSKVDNSKDVNILVQMDRTPNYSAEYGDWTQTLRFKISKNMVPTKEQSIMDLGETNMGDPSTLTNFLTWSIQNYPAEKYILIIWDHGDGWKYNEASTTNKKLERTYLQDYKSALAANENLKYKLAFKKANLMQSQLAALKSDQKKLTSDLNSTAQKITILPDELKEKVTSSSNFSNLYSSFKDFTSNNFENIPLNQLSFIDKYSNTLKNVLLNNIKMENIQQKIEVPNSIDTAITELEVRNLKMGSFEANPVKAVSHDNSDNDVLYNKEMHDALPDKIVNIIGFDACLMSMIETGYTLRGKADFLIGSEDLEPGNGWNYTLWLENLVENPQMQPLELSKSIVDNYGKVYQYQNEVTLSAIDLTLVQKLADLLNNFTITMINKMTNEQNNITLARGNCQKYATDFASIHSVDLSLFLYHFNSKTSDISLKNQCIQLRSLINLLVIANFHSDDRCFEPEGISYGSFGLAIYFPKRKDYFDSAYTDGNSYFPVEFVKDNSWDNFLQSYFSNL